MYKGSPLVKSVHSAFNTMASARCLAASELPFNAAIASSCDSDWHPIAVSTATQALGESVPASVTASRRIDAKLMQFAVVGSDAFYEERVAAPVHRANAEFSLAEAGGAQWLECLRA